MSEADKREMQIEDMIYDLLVSMGISPMLKGFRILECCIKAEVMGKRDISATQMYQDIAQKGREPWINVARAVHFAIKKAIKAIGMEGIAEQIGDIVPLRGKIEPITFIRNSARKIRGQIA